MRLRCYAPPPEPCGLNVGYFDPTIIKWSDDEECGVANEPGPFLADEERLSFGREQDTGSGGRRPVK